MSQKKFYRGRPRPTAQEMLRDQELKRPEEDIDRSDNFMSEYFGKDFFDRALAESREYDGLSFEDGDWYYEHEPYYYDDVLYYR